MVARTVEERKFLKATKEKQLHNRPRVEETFKRIYSLKVYYTVYQHVYIREFDYRNDYSKPYFPPPPSK